MHKIVGGNIPTNSAKEAIDSSAPYSVEIEITGSANMLFHRWQCEYVAEKAKAAKGSKSKKTDDIETFVYRDPSGNICLPGEYFRQSIIHAAKFRQDPRSPRKSAMDLFKAAVIVETELASLGIKKWDYEDHRRVVIQRSAITRVRPAISKGWKVTFIVLVLLPEYIAIDDLQDTIMNAGRLIGVGDFRPTYGRFYISKFNKL